MSVTTGQATGAMQFDLPGPLVEFRTAMRAFVDEECIPLEGRSCDGHRLKPDVRERLERAAQSRGLWLLHVPGRFGGKAQGLLAKVILWQEAGRTTALLARSRAVFGPEPGALLSDELDDDQQQRYLLPLIRGEALTAFAQTEPGFGSDPSRMATRAVLSDGVYVINGQKKFVGGADDATFIQVVAATDPAKGARGGISVFLIDAGAPGLKIELSVETMMRDRLTEITFDNVRVGPENRIGAEGRGFQLAQRWMTEMRIKHAARSIGVIERCLELASRRARERNTFGAPLAERQAVQLMVARMFTQLHQLRLMTYHAAWKYDNGGDIAEESFMAKVFGDESSFEAADACMQLHGALGVTTSLPIETLWHDQRAMRIAEGATEVLNTTLGKRVITQY
jgi:acyl-CoA dehydrogenase